MAREGGPLEQRRTEAGRLEMVRAAGALSQMVRPPGRGCSVSFLSGEKYWYQTLFCIWSLQLNSDVGIDPVIYDDGTFTVPTLEAIASVVPWTRFVLRDEIARLLDEHLPVSRFPSLRARRLEYPHIRKLTDVHVGKDDWTMVMDSDILFFRRPSALLEWFVKPERPCHLVDVESSYGYSDALMIELAGCRPPELVNVGICALDSSEIDWDHLEYCCRTTISREGRKYLQEQGLTAILLSGSSCLRLPADEYQVRPDLPEGRDPQAVLHHYVAESKRSYFQYGWRHVMFAANRDVVVAR
jgi:hypothetical protein